MAKQSYFLHQYSGQFSKKHDLCPHVQLQTVVCLFLWQFWSSGFFHVERPFRLCRYRTHFTVDIDTFVLVSSSIFTRFFAVVLGLICTFRTKVPGDRTCLLSKRYDGCVVPWCLYLRTCHDFFRSRLLSLSGWRSAVDVTGFLAIAAPILNYPFLLSCSLNNWF